MENQLIETFSYVLPALITGGVAFFMFNAFVKQDNNEKKFEALVNKKRESLPVKLQAYERLLLFCERINPSKLLLRVNPIGTDANSYLHLLINNIEQEFEHNMVQQLYVSEESWKAVLASKFAIVNKLHEIAEKNEEAKELREEALATYAKIESPTETAIAILKQQVKKLI